MIEFIPPANCIDDATSKIVYASLGPDDAGKTMEQIVMGRKPEAIFNKSRYKVTSLKDGSQATGDFMMWLGGGPIEGIVDCSTHCIYFKDIEAALSHVSEKHPEIELMPAEHY